MLPIIKWCAHKNMLGVYTRMHVNKHASVFQLGTSDYRSDYILEHVGLHVNHAETPNCKLDENDIVAVVDLKPGDEITLKKQT
jgi:hypothetical protein